jgi:lysophospholipase L1-like esterase
MGRFRTRTFRLATLLTITTAATLLSVQSVAAAGGAYTALGDSYSSGVGTRGYYADSGSCYRSPQAYPPLVAQGISAQLTFAACSGARVPDIYNQLGSLNADTDLVTLSVGGNDAGFVDVITRCALPWPWTCWGHLTNANNFISGTLPGQLDALYGTIRNRAPNANVIIIGYPRIFNGEECNFGARISSGEQAELNNTANLLATTIAARAGAHGFGYVDPRTSFTGHAICDDVEWINGLANPIMESYHPNTGGQASYRNLVLNRLGAPVPAGNPAAA